MAEQSNQSNSVDKMMLKMMATETVPDEKADDLINNKIMDTFLFKLRIDLENKNGILLILVSFLKPKVILVYSYFGNSPLIKRVRTFEDYNQLFNDCTEILRSGGVDKSISEVMGRAMYRLLTPSVIEENIKLWEQKNLDIIYKIVEKVSLEELKGRGTIIQIDVEKVNSIRLRQANRLYEIVKPVTSPLDNSNTEKKETPEELAQKLQSLVKTPLEIEVEELQKLYPRIIACNTVVSPVSGVDFSQIKPAQKLLFSLPFKTSEDKSLANTLGGVTKEGEPIPIVGEFIKIISSAKNEHHIFAKGPNNVLLRAFEERPVKIGIPKDSKNLNREEESGGGFVSYLVGLFALGIFLVVMYYMFVK